MGGEKLSYDAINKVARLEEDFPTKKISQVTIGQLYRVHEFRMAKTRYGEKVLVLLNGEFLTFLPKRLSTGLAEQSKEFTALKQFLRFLGGQYNLCEFSIIDETTPDSPAKLSEVSIIDEITPDATATTATTPEQTSQ